MSGKTAAYARNASISDGKDITQLCACVPVTGRPKVFPAQRWLVVSTPPTAAARVADSAPSGPWARRAPNSTTLAGAAARTTREALVAIRVSKFTMLRSAVSTT